MADRDEIVAAGGLVIDESATPVRILLVHRQRYDDWSFPKGKALPGETLEQTALREVGEETGLQCLIVSKLTAVNYDYRTHKGHLRPKVVHYYLMDPESTTPDATQGAPSASASPQPDGLEVDALEWLTLDDAAARLSYEIDREVLRQLSATLDTVHQDTDFPD